MSVKDGCHRTGLLPGDLEELLDELRRRRFSMVAFNADHHGPDVLGGVFRYRNERCVDVIVFHSLLKAIAWRAPLDESDEFAPAQVYWASFGSSAGTVSSLLRLPGPGEAGAPSGVLDAPPGVGVPAELRRRYRLWPAMFRG